LWAARLGINAVYGPLIGRSGQHCIQPNGYNEGADQFVSDIIVAAHRHGWTVTTRLDPCRRNCSPQAFPHAPSLRSTI